MNKKLIGLFVLLCVLIGASRKYNLFSMDESYKQKVKEYHERLKAAQENPKAQKKLRERLEKAPDLVRRSVKQESSCPLSDEFVNFLLGGAPIVLRGHRDAVSSVAFSPDSSKLATGSEDNTAKLWDVDTGKLLRTFRGHENSVHSVAFSPDGSKLATGSLDNSAKLWDAHTGQLLRTLAGHTGSIDSVAFSPDGSKVVTGSWDKTAKLWDVNTGQLLHVLAGPNGHAHAVCSVAFSPDGSKIATGSLDDSAKLWDVNTGQLLRTIKGHEDTVISIAFSPDGTKLATGSYDTTAKLWDVNTGKLLHTLAGHTSLLMSIAFSPDGNTLATGSNDTTAKLWDIDTGKLLHTLVCEDMIFESIAFSPDGSKIATGLYEGMAKLWDINRLIRIAELRKKEIEEKGKKFKPDFEKTISLDRFLKVLPDNECEKDPEYCNIMSVEQCELLRAFENTFKKDQTGRPVGRIQATQLQWQTFKTLPQVLQEILRVRIKEPQKSQNEKPVKKRKRRSSQPKLSEIEMEGEEGN